MRKKTKSMADHQKHPRAGLAFGKSRCTYLLRKDNSQNHGNKQTKRKRKQKKLNDKELLHHSPVNLVPGRLWCTALQLSCWVHRFDICCLYIGPHGGVLLNATVKHYIKYRFHFGLFLLYPGIYFPPQLFYSNVPIWSHWRKSKSSLSCCSLL